MANQKPNRAPLFREVSVEDLPKAPWCHVSAPKLLHYMDWPLGGELGMHAHKERHHL